MGLVTRETKRLECQPHPPTSRKGRVGLDIELYRNIMNSEIQKAPSLVNNSRCCKGDVSGKVLNISCRRNSRMIENLNKLKVPASKYLSSLKDSNKGKDSNFIVEKQAGTNLTKRSE
ncbi:unnamed protein product [Rangifer tarandus platyrhynchus]|uniref:Uncharacterized protein n=1 Tax=Rangifer tarandus platyrhynchus TaxID=3082113 RepID=A0ABN8XSM8_RANTA|nr:unnamed protein product [Rangifer tarandus platyrhynchus]